MTEGGSFAHSSFHVGTDWQVSCHVYEYRTPILSVSAGPYAVAFSLNESGADEAAVTFARDLVREAQLFAAEVERLHAARLADESNPKAERSSTA